MSVLLLLLLLLSACATKEAPLPPVQAVPNTLEAFQLPALYNPPPPLPEPELPPPPKAPGKNELRYAYEDGTLDLVPVSVGYTTTVRLQPGERIRALTGGDLAPVPEGEAQAVPADKAQKDNCWVGARWHLCQGESEYYGLPLTHLAIAATHEKQAQGVDVLTNVRLYKLELKSTKARTKGLVTWSYPELPWRPQTPKAPTIFPDNGDARQYHVGYTFTLPDPAPAWTPLKVYSDTKMYLQFDPTLLYQHMPLIRGMNYAGQPRLVNMKQVGNWVIIDELAPRLELRDGPDAHAQVVVITRAALHTIQCPGHADCPVWPAH